MSFSMFNERGDLARRWRPMTPAEAARVPRSGRLSDGDTRPLGRLQAPIQLHAPSGPVAPIPRTLARAA